MHLVHGWQDHFTGATRNHFRQKKNARTALIVTVRSGIIVIIWCNWRTKKR